MIRIESFVTNLLLPRPTIPPIESNHHSLNLGLKLDPNIPYPQIIPLIPHNRF